MNAPAPVPSKDDLRSAAIATLLAVAKDRQAPAAARAAASRTILESIGDIGRLQEVARLSDKQLNQMSLEEMDEEIARLKPKA